ncbi:MAG: hypothetical protein LBS19_04145 [Clostridiales bacterium]|nr:hypothetical protein [Clostridiales bacterium]
MTLLPLGLGVRYPHADCVYELLDILESMLNLRVDFITVNGMRTGCSAAFKNSVEAESRWFYEA